MIEFMKELAVEAGKLSLAEFARMNHDQVEYKSARDIVTVADKAVEQLIYARVTRETPDYAFFGEESGRTAAKSDYCWVIDPIDGTASFAAELPIYCVSIALQYRGETVKAAIYAPRLGELFWAEKGGGAFLNDRRLQVSSCAELSDAMLATGFACLRAGLKENNLPRFNRIAPLVRGISRLGSAAIDLCYVAAGRFAAYWEIGLQPYDYAGGMLLVTEAGGTIGDLDGGHDLARRGIVATNVAIDRELLPYLRA
ncbi:MAG: inositol monophosphatase family protein [Victivallales bacterium]|nr:inositol monophosphatase family protein [Victivallales bacterium]